MYCHVPMTQAMVILNPDFGTGIEKHHLKKQVFFVFFFFFGVECMEWFHKSGMLGFFKYSRIICMRNLNLL